MKDRYDLNENRIYSCFHNILDKIAIVVFLELAPTLHQPAMSDGFKQKDEAALALLEQQLPWVEKYRPVSLEEVISHEQVIKTMSRLIDANRMPHVLLYGPPGTGKTSTIMACAKKLHGDRFRSMILELNASDERGINVVRDQIKSFASSRQLFSSGYKLVILDEADNMTKAAQFALRRVIEKYTKNTRFCLICNYVNRIIPAIQSRCTRFRLGPLKTEQVKDKLRLIAEKEGAALEENGLEALVKLAQGDMRKCLNVMQACHVAYPSISEDAVYLCTGNPLPSDMDAIYHSLVNDPIQKSFKVISNLQTEKGLSLVDILSSLHELVLATQFPAPIMTFILAELSNMQYRMAFGTSERLQLGGLVGVFQKVRIALAALADSD